MLNIDIRFTKRHTQGFTLLELLISVSVLAILVGMIYGTFTSVTNTIGLARDCADRLRFKQIVWRNFSANLQGVYTDAGATQPEYQFLGETNDGAYGSADTLRFATSLPIPGPQSLPGIAKWVTYEVVGQEEVSETIAAALPYDEDRPGSVLVIREEPLQLESQDFVASTSDGQWDIFERAIPVASMDIQYYDGIAKEWMESWDSLEERRLPGGVWIRINFPRSEEERNEDYRNGITPEEHPDLELMMSFPLGRNVEFPFPDFNHLRVIETEEL
ncbi:MAG: prepilin-type N-terminal cleavage/methylation domain-containing protein [Candidatus Hydrogenedentes bacterium]|nr:prepilin-type N-terminal cleavage/methylation domain-containing protein [Candidatus Hydrogenedentota bacterium]